jgi:hypothetical protein
MERDIDFLLRIYGWPKNRKVPFMARWIQYNFLPTNAKTRTISQQKAKLGTFSNKSHDSNHLSNNIVYRKLLNQRHSIKTLQMVSKILHMFVVAGFCLKMFRVLSFAGKWFEFWRLLDKWFEICLWCVFCIVFSFDGSRTLIDMF